MVPLWAGGFSSLLSTGTTRDGLWQFSDDKTTCEISLTQAKAESGSDDEALSDTAIMTDRDLPADAAGNIYDSTAGITGRDGACSSAPSC